VWVAGHWLKRPGAGAGAWGGGGGAAPPRRAGRRPTPLRVGAVVAGVLAAVGAFMLTAKGVATREFLFEARFELRKVVWPTRQEAVRMTWVVMIVVAIIALLLMGFDAIIRVGIRFLLGQ
jgi:preprotein translocase subunit SecE